MDEDAGASVDSLSSDAGSDVDSPGALPGKPPERRRTSMTQQGALSIGEYGCPATPGIDDPRVSNREDLSMYSVQPPAPEPFLDRPLGHAEGA